MPAWLGGLFSFLGTALKLIAQAWRDSQERKAGATAQAADEQKETIREIQTATDARDAAHGDIVSHPDRLREDDGFKRPD